MNCILYFYKDDELRKKYGPETYEKRIRKRNKGISELCNVYFDKILVFDKTKITKLSIPEPVNRLIQKEPRSKPSVELRDLMHQLTLVLFCGNCEEMRKEFEYQRTLRHFTHYHVFTNGENFTELYHMLKSLTSLCEVSGFKKISLVVFDLDDTLVDESFRPLSEKLTRQLMEFKRLFDYVVLWSHGTTNHVREALQTVNIPENFFHLVITRPTLHPCGNNKGLGFVLSELYKRHQICEISFSCIIDDTASNYTDDYMLFVPVPKQLKHLTRFYDEVLRKIPEIKEQHEHGKGRIPSRILQSQGHR